ncbi:MAG: outer-membrane lipoprotein carrier protein LolA [Alphaproteobacteria bacterium]|nr:outer membrane lipoprotein carrier protein LolA [Alphaproteobacteria bacterium]MDE2111081.1 outer-membrane lipoprotein carrier protein LolA [Alphaproteobacteria bacterium]MDE2494781.1 outer-membrane lipoprotein carrier protein LolA [Alphaproteobacteria bacterium]
MLSDTDRADLDRVSAYLNSIHTLTGDFVQIDPDGEIDQGRFFMQKPGRMRFEYSPPNPILIVSDGSTVAVANRKLNTVDRYPLSATPLDLILSDDIDLRHDNEVMAVRRQPGELIIEARSSANRTKPNITLVFTDPVLELRQWTVVDDQGQTTTVALRDLQPGAAIDGQMFVLRNAPKAVGTRSRD